MKKEFEELIRLQEIDLRIHELEMSKVEFPQQVTEREGIIAKAQAELDAAKKILAKLHDEVQTIHEREAEAREALTRSQLRLNSITTNREYDAVHAEIEAHKATLSSSGSRLEAVEKQIRQQSELVAKAQAALEAVKAEHEPAIAELKEKIATIDSRIAAEVQERSAVESRVPKHFLTQYVFIRTRRKNARVLSLVDSSRTCTECHKILEPQIVNELKRGLKLPSCTSCGSLLIWTAPVIPLPDEPMTAHASSEASQTVQETAGSPDVDAAVEPEIDDEPVDLIDNIEDLAAEAEEQ